MTTKEQLQIEADLLYEEAGIMRALEILKSKQNESFKR